jgi:hypothetical protein
VKRPVNKHKLTRRQLVYLNILHGAPDMTARWQVAGLHAGELRIRGRKPKVPLYGARWHVHAFVEDVRDLQVAYRFSRRSAIEAARLGWRIRGGGRARFEAAFARHEREIMTELRRAQKRST